VGLLVDVVERDGLIADGEQVSGLASQGVADGGKGAVSDGAGPSVLEDTEVGDGEAGALGELDEGHVPGLEEGAEVALDVNTILTGGRVVRGIVEGESVPSEFLPQLVELWRTGRFPVDRMMTYYDFDQIDQAAKDAEAGLVIKPVLRIG